MFAPCHQVTADVVQACCAGVGTNTTPLQHVEVQLSEVQVGITPSQWKDAHSQDAWWNQKHCLEWLLAWWDLPVTLLKERGRPGTDEELVFLAQVSRRGQGLVFLLPQVQSSQITHHSYTRPPSTHHYIMPP